MRFKSQNRKPVQPELVASKDESRPVLSKVHLNVEASEVWVCDSYMAARFPVDLDEGDTSGPIPVEALKAARKPPLRGSEGRILVNHHVDVVMDGKGQTHSDPYVTLPRESAEYQFPNLDELFPESGTVFEVGLNAKKLHDLAKAFGQDEVRLSFIAGRATNVDGDAGPSNLRPILVNPISAREDDGKGLLMPIRIK